MNERGLRDDGWEESPGLVRRQKLRFESQGRKRQNIPAESLSPQRSSSDGVVHPPAGELTVRDFQKNIYSNGSGWSPPGGASFKFSCIMGVYFLLCAFIYF